VEEPETPERCSFCLKSRDDVAVLVAGPDGSICDGCAGVAVDIVREDLAAREHTRVVQQAAEERWPHLPCALCGSAGTMDILARLMPLVHHATLPDGKVVCARCVAAIIAAVDEAARGEP
jgi:ClpX C4-type zinc finger